MRLPRLVFACCLCWAAVGRTQSISINVDYTNDDFVFRAVDSTGTAYATNLAEQSSKMWMSTDNARTWSYQGVTPDNADFKATAALSTGTLLANTQNSSGDYNIARSADQGVTWTDVLSLGQYQILSPHSIAESNGTVYLIEYQVFTNDSVPIDLWASTDDGQSWSVRYTFQGHRHAHCVRVDATGALWVFFGDSITQSGIYRSTDQGNSWTEVLAGEYALGDDALFLSNGDALYGQDISNLPYEPFVVTLSPAGLLTNIAQLPGPAYSIQATPAGGYLLGETWEPNDTVYAPGDTSAHLLGSPDGVNWSVLGAYPTSDTTSYGRADVYWALSSGEVVLTLDNVTTLASTEGYELLQVTVSGSSGSDGGVDGGSDGGTGSSDGGVDGGSDGGTGISDGGIDGGTSISFSDSFADCTATSGLDPAWTTAGTWYCEAGRARGESADGLALADTDALGNTSVTALVQLDGSTGSGVVARAANGNYYAAVLVEGSGVDIISVNGSATTVLDSGSIAIANETSYTLGLNVTGTNPVSLQALVNGAVVATAVDSSSAALTSGSAGLLSGASARTQYANFSVTGTAGPPASGPPPGPPVTSFSDSFADCTATSGLDPSWTTDGTWYCEGGYARGQSAGGLALVLASLPADQTATARVQLTGVASGSGVITRATSTDFYAARILAAGSIEIDRVDSGTITPLASLSTSFQEGVFYRIGLSVSGSSPVTLAASVNGATVLNAIDSGAVLASGGAGLYSGTTARTQFNDFAVTSP